MNTRKLWTTIISVLLVSIGLSACGSNNQAQEQTAKTPIRFGVSKWIGWGPIYIAAEKGLFKQEGVEVQMATYDDYDSGQVDFASKKLDMNASTITDSVAQAAAGVPLQLVWVFDNSAGGDVIVGKSDLASPQDLKGKRVGLAAGTFSEVFVTSGLAKYGLTSSDITIVNLKEDKIPGALKAGQIDAGHTWDPYLSEAVKDGGKIIFTSTDTPGIIASVLLAQSNVVEKRQADVQAVIRAVIAAQKWWGENTDEGNKIVATAIAIKPEEMPDTLKGVKLFNLQDNVTAFDQATAGTESLYKSGQLTIDIFTQKKIFDKGPDLQKLINPAFVQALAGK